MHQRGRVKLTGDGIVETDVIAKRCRPGNSHTFTEATNIRAARSERLFGSSTRGRKLHIKVTSMRDGQVHRYTHSLCIVRRDPVHLSNGIFAKLERVCPRFMQIEGPCTILAAYRLTVHHCFADTMRRVLPKNVKPVEYFRKGYRNKFYRELNRILFTF